MRRRLRAFMCLLDSLSQKCKKSTQKNVSSYTPNHTHTHIHTHTQVIHAAQPSYKDVVKSSLEEEQYRTALKEKDQEIADLRKKLEKDRYVAKYAWSVRMIE